jgi:hypothetical protein
MNGMIVEMRSFGRISSSCIHILACGRATCECMKENALFFYALKMVFGGVRTARESRIFYGSKED